MTFGILMETTTANAFTSRIDKCTNLVDDYDTLCSFDNQDAKSKNTEDNNGIIKLILDKMNI